MQSGGEAAFTHDVECCTVQVIADQDWQPEACQWRFASDLLPGICSYAHQDVVNLVMFTRDGSVLILSIGTAPRQHGLLASPRETTERSLYPLASSLPGVKPVFCYLRITCTACTGQQPQQTQTAPPHESRNHGKTALTPQRCTTCNVRRPHVTVTRTCSALSLHHACSGAFT